MRDDLAVLNVAPNRMGQFFYFLRDNRYQRELTAQDGVDITRTAMVPSVMEQHMFGDLFTFVLN